jgi:hypothetical protein
MKSVWIFSLLILGISTSWSQNEQTGVLEAPLNEDRFLVEFNNDSWLGYPESVTLRPYSPGIGAFITYDYQLGKSPISLVWGYGFSSHNVHHDGIFTPDSLLGKSYTRLTGNIPGFNPQKNKHSTSYIEVPFAIRLRTKGDNKFKLYLGAKVGYLVNIHSKTIDDAGKRKFYGLDNVMPYRYGLVARVGFNMVAVSGFYSLTPLLKEGKGDEFYPISIGLTFFLL